MFFFFFLTPFFQIFSWPHEKPVGFSHYARSCSVAKSCPALQPHGLQHARLPCPPLSPGICSNSCPLRLWGSLTISSSATRFSFCLQSLPASGSFPMSWLFTSGGQSIGASALVLAMNIQGWFPLGWTGLFSLQSKGLSRVFSTVPQFESISSSVLSLLYCFKKGKSYWSQSLGLIPGCVTLCVTDPSLTSSVNGVNLLSVFHMMVLTR